MVSFSSNNSNRKILNFEFCIVYSVYCICECWIDNTKRQFCQENGFMVGPSYIQVFWKGKALMFNNPKKEESTTTNILFGPFHKDDLRKIVHLCSKSVSIALKSIKNQRDSTIGFNPNKTKNSTNNRGNAKIKEPPAINVEFLS